MSTVDREFRWFDSSKYSDIGEWFDEPDTVIFRDEESGFYCVINRNWGGALCGYVGVPEGHPLHGVHYNDERAADLTAHGGITYSEGASPAGKHGEGILPPNTWWFGFDCAHLHDFQPAFSDRLKHFGAHAMFGGRYRNMQYVRSDVEDLAMQLRYEQRLLENKNDE